MRVVNLASRMFYKLHGLFLPELFSPSEDDVYLVSYPRSGNTWMRTIISNLLYRKSVDGLKDLQYYVPDIHVKTYADEVVPAKFHVIKSHFAYQNNSNNIKKYKRVVYIIRDPRDVVLSHYRYQKYLSSYNSGFENFFIDWINGRVWPCSWQEHVNSWTGDGTHELEINLHVIRYEDLLSDTTGQIVKLIDFLEFDISREAIQQAIASASAEKMRLKEKHSMREEEKADGFQFIGAAKSKQWKDKLTNDQLDVITKYAGAAMERFGYI